jgi:hypothetical protein
MCLSKIMAPVRQQLAGYLREADLIGSSARPGRPFVLPFSSSTLWRRVRDGSFPSPVKLSPGVTAWSASSVQAWLDAREGSAPARMQGGSSK